LLQALPAQQSAALAHPWPWDEQQTSLRHERPLAQQPSPQAVQGTQLPVGALVVSLEQEKPVQQSALLAQLPYCGLQHRSPAHCWSDEQQRAPQPVHATQLLRPLPGVDSAQVSLWPEFWQQSDSTLQSPDWLTQSGAT